MAGQPAQPYAARRRSSRTTDTIRGPRADASGSQLRSPGPICEPPFGRTDSFSSSAARRCTASSVSSSLMRRRATRSSSRSTESPESRNRTTRNRVHSSREGGPTKSRQPGGWLAQLSACPRELSDRHRQSRIHVSVHRHNSGLATLPSPSRSASAGDRSWGQVGGWHAEPWGQVLGSGRLLSAGSCMSALYVRAREGREDEVASDLSRLAGLQQDCAVRPSPSPRWLAPTLAIRRCAAREVVTSARTSERGRRLVPRSAPRPSTHGHSSAGPLRP